MIATLSIRKRLLCGIAFALALSSMTATADECGELQSRLAAAERQQREAKNEIERFEIMIVLNTEKFRDASAQMDSRVPELFDATEPGKKLFIERKKELQTWANEVVALGEFHIAASAARLQEAVQSQHSIRQQMAREPHACRTPRGPATAAPGPYLPDPRRATAPDVQPESVEPRTGARPRGVDPQPNGVLPRTVRQPPHIHPENVRRTPTVTHAARESARARLSPRTVMRPPAIARTAPRTVTRVVRPPVMARPAPRTVMRQPAIVRQPPPRIQVNCKMSSANCRRR